MATLRFGVFFGFLALSAGQISFFSLLDDRCMNGTFLGDAMTCFVEKFLTINITSQSFHSRSLKSADSLNFHARGQKLHDVYRHSNILHKSVMRQMNHDNDLDQVPLTKEQQTALKQLEGLDIKRYLHDFVSLVTEAYGRVKAAVELYDITSESDVRQMFQLNPKDALDDLISALKHFTQCTATIPQEEFEDGLTWIRCLYTCDDLPLIATCMDRKYLANNCGIETQIFKQFMVRAFQQYVHLDQCYIKIIEPANLTNYQMRLVEGGPPQHIVFQQYLPTDYHCINMDDFTKRPSLFRANLILRMFQVLKSCNVTVTMTTSNYVDSVMPHFPILDLGKPKCRNNRLMTQSVIGRHDSASENFCVLNVTSSNWNQTYRVPLYATVDHAKDGNVLTNLTLKFTIGLDIRQNVKIPTLIVDRDFNKASTCRSINDPHLHTFDGHYYNNFYEGYFYLWKHATLPYQVQVIYQKCKANATASCTCAVAIASGDDVLVVDKCRRKVGSCVDCEDVTWVRMYVNGDVTPGTRVFKKDGGLRYEVWNPHGTMIKVIATNSLLNVHIVPSSADRNSSQGLCGNFDGDDTDDLMFPNGTIYQGEGDQHAGQPRPFSKSWRVPPEERIFQGSRPNNNFTSTNYCSCHYVVLAGVQCTCSHDLLVEDCNQDLEGEITENITAITQASNKTEQLYNVERMGPVNLEIDIDENFEPPDLADPTPPENKIVCRDILGLNATNTFVAKCRQLLFLFNDNIEDFVQGCAEDYEILGNHNFSQSTLEGIKQYCLEEVRRSDVSEIDIRELNSLNCINDCSGQGQCTNGTCVCYSSFTGADCSLLLSDKPSIHTNPNFFLCDKRAEDCSKAKLTGLNIFDSSELKCQVRNIEVDSKGVQERDGVTIVDIIHVSYSQLACLLPEKGSYKINIVWKGSSIDHYVNMAAYDPACYACDISSQTCQRKMTNDHCLINGQCYMHQEQDPGHVCKICNVTSSSDSFVFMTDDYCKSVEDDEAEKRRLDDYYMTIRIACSVSVSVAIVILAIVLYCCCGRDSKKEKEDIVPAYISEVKLEESNSKQSVSNGYDNEVFATTDYEVRNSSAMPKSPDYEVINSGTMPKNPDVARNKRITELEGERARTSSVSSVGIGASGPMHFARYARRSTEDDENVGIGAHGPLAARKDAQSITVARL